MPEEEHAADPTSDGVKRREARGVITAYHQEQLRALLERVRDGFEQLDAGEIDEFELDDLVFRYKKAAKNLWVFCEAGGSDSRGTAAAIAAMRGRGEERDWWAESASRRDRT